MYTNTARWGWGTHLETREARETFEWERRVESSNWRELSVILKRVKVFLPLL
jgi:hypothetical protein